MIGTAIKGLVEGIRGGREYSRDHECEQYRIFSVLCEGLWGNDAHTGQKDDDDGKFEHRAEGKDELQAEVHIITHRQHGCHGADLVGQQKAHGKGKDKEEAERQRLQEKEASAYHERTDILSFLCRAVPEK